MNEEINVICPSCHKEAEWVPNEVVYNGKRYGKSYMMWFCRACDYRVGCHNNTREPLGTMVGKELRQLRMAVHKKIDPIWQSKQLKRSHMYARISKAIGYSYHTGEADEETCRKILSLDMSIFNKEQKSLL